jgi:Arc/MetJ-type ribon-helix-helix transcriptional regulator
MTEKKMGRPQVDTEPVTIRMSRDMIKAIDDYRRTQEDLPTRPEVIRRVLAAWLEAGKDRS